MISARRKLCGATLLGTLLLSFPAFPQEPPPPSQSSDAAPPAASWLPRLEDLEATRRMPLFLATRSPPEAVAEPVAMPLPEPAAEVAIPPVPPPVRLVGLVIVGGVTSVLLKDESTGQTQRLKAGDRLMDWELRVTGLREVQLVQGDASHRLQLFAP